MYTRRTMGLALGLGLAIAGCSDTTETTAPAGPSLAQGPNAACSFNGVKQDIRNFFPGNGRGSSKELALAIAASLETHCNASQAAAYTAKTFELLKMIETGLEGDLPDGPMGSPASGNAMLGAIITMASPTAPNAPEPDLFDPCGAAGPPPGPAAGATCLAWDGWPTAPDFTSALSGPDNMFAVIGPAGLGAVELTSAQPICSGPAAPCETVRTGTNPDTWGFAPESPSTWSDVQGGNTSLFWGYPLDPNGPTGETPLALGAGFFASSMPFFEDFPGDHELEVTYCTVEDPGAGLIASIAHDASATEPGTIGAWCMPGGHASLSGGGFFGTLASLARSALGVRPLFAGLHAGSPVGGIGGFGSEFYAFETAPTGVLDGLNFPTRDATTGGPIVGADGQPLRVRARTSTSTAANPTGIERVVLELVLGNNNGTIPSGNTLFSLYPSNPDVVCSNTSPLPAWHGSTPPPGNVCRTRTGADQTAGAGVAVFAGIASTKNGGFKPVIQEWTGSPSPFDFAPVQAGDFNVNPN